MDHCEIITEVMGKIFEAATGTMSEIINLENGIYIGVDGCSGGWIACILDHGWRYEP